MPIFLPILLLLFLALIVLSVPISIIRRYRLGTARRLARPWVAAVNVFGMSCSAVIFLATAALSGMWVPMAFRYCIWGMAGGLALGCLGSALTEWAPGSRSLYYTPNRWLVLALTLGVTARLCFGFWRAWNAWHTTHAEGSWLAHSGVAGSMAAGAIVIGYYLAFWVGVWRKAASFRDR